MLDCCLIIPLSPKHYFYAENFLRKINDVLDIYLVFSNEQDFLKFPMKTGYLPIIIPPDFKIGNSVVTEKKFYALRHLQKSHYDYFIVCDAEIDIVSENFIKTNILKKIQDIFQNKFVYGGKNNDEILKDISKTSANVFCGSDYQKLSQMTDVFTYYFWWSDLPVYKRDHLENFFSTINEFDLQPRHFDYLIYTYYLLLYQNFTIIDVSTLIGCHSSLENYCDDNDEKLAKLTNVQYGFSWVSPFFFNKKRDFLLQQGTFLLYHLDRYFAQVGFPYKEPEIIQKKETKTTKAQFINNKKQININSKKAQSRRPFVIFNKKK